MTEAPVKRTSQRELAAVIAAYEAAVVAHHDWLERWHRSLICRLSMPQRLILSPNAHRICKLGRWQRSQDSSALFNHPVFMEIRELHRSAHELARQLALQSRAGNTITAKDYKQFVDVEGRLSARLLKLDWECHELLAGYDALTGTFSRNALDLVLNKERARAGRTGRPCSVCLVDLDDFKLINDNHGHLAGDVVLKRTGAFLLSHLRPYDTVARYGGDEFLLCLPDATPEKAYGTLERLREALSRLPINVGQQLTVHITVSIGIAVLCPEMSIETSLERADKALYEAKAGGRNRTVKVGS